MTTAADRRAFRTSQRDAMAHGDVRPGTGPNSTVSPDALTTIARAAAAQSARPALSGDLANSVRAAALPPVTPAQTRGGATAGERTQPTTQRTPGKDGHTR